MSDDVVEDFQKRLAEVRGETDDAPKRKPRWDHNMRYKDGKNGRPGHLRKARYTKKMGKYICDRIIEGATLTKLCASDPDLPPITAVMKWARNPDHHFYEIYREARKAAADLLTDEIIDIADDATPETANKDKLRIDTRKWMAQNLVEDFSEKKDGAVGGDVHVTIQSDGNGLQGKVEGAKE